jgi:hypothetical protein
MTKIVVDAMGSDNYPTPDVIGVGYGRPRIWSGDHSGRGRIKDQTGAERHRTRAAICPSGSSTRPKC